MKNQASKLTQLKDTIILYETHIFHTNSKIIYALILLFVRNSQRNQNLYGTSRGPTDRQIFGTQ